MITDQAKFVALMSEFGVELDQEHGSFSMEAQCSPKVKGYFGFAATFNFDADGKFIDVEINE